MRYLIPFKIRGTIVSCGPLILSSGRGCNRHCAIEDMKLPGSLLVPVIGAEIIGPRGMSGLSLAVSPRGCEDQTMRSGSCVEQIAAVLTQIEGCRVLTSHHEH